MRAELVRAERQTDRHDGAVVSFYGIANAHKQYELFLTQCLRKLLSIFHTEVITACDNITLNEVN